MPAPSDCSRTIGPKLSSAIEYDLTALRHRLDALEGMFSELHRLPSYDHTISVTANLRTALEARTEAQVLAQHILAASSLSAAQEGAQGFLAVHPYTSPNQDQHPASKLEHATFAIEQALDEVAGAAADVSLIGLAHRLELEDLLIDGHDLVAALESLAAALSGHAEAEPSASVE